MTLGRAAGGYDYTESRDEQGVRYLATYNPRGVTRHEAEWVHFAEGHGSRAEHPTQAGAITAWKAAHLARARGGR